MKTILSATFFVLFVIVLVMNAETKGNIDVVMYRGAGWMVLPQYAGLQHTEVLWVSATDQTGQATHMVMSLTCGSLVETRMVEVHGKVATTAWPRSREQTCTVVVNSVQARESQTFEEGR